MNNTNATTMSHDTSHEHLLAHHPENGNVELLPLHTPRTPPPAQGRTPSSLEALRQLQADRISSKFSRSQHRRDANAVKMTQIQSASPSTPQLPTASSQTPTPNIKDAPATLKTPDNIPSTPPPPCTHRQTPSSLSALHTLDINRNNGVLAAQRRNPFDPPETAPSALEWIGNNWHVSSLSSPCLDLVLFLAVSAGACIYDGIVEARREARKEKARKEKEERGREEREKEEREKEESEKEEKERCLEREGDAEMEVGKWGEEYQGEVEGTK
ncbi:hypothetical protein CC80DRAFT_588107 [Byssothecium circinans]|uniref:Uncharacterized protein n=1 Tax=Byssothecium circinans TaxID=147558 RepID=A0A6A5ULG9_9PLEO|nr:hypothetical protein CC80DRAFT_588107 [Byssothecium circinans]